MTALARPLAFLALLAAASAHLCIVQPTQRQIVTALRRSEESCAAVRSCVLSKSAPHRVEPGPMEVTFSVDRYTASHPIAFAVVSLVGPSGAVSSRMVELSEGQEVLRTEVHVPAASSDLELEISLHYGASFDSLATVQQCADVQLVSAPQVVAKAAPVASSEPLLGGLMDGLRHTLALGPLHASCKLTWTFAGQQCSDVNAALIKAAQSMAGDSCGSSEKCLYSLTSQSASELKLVHETPKKHYKDDLVLDFTQSGSDCQVKGSSSSEIWYAVLDSGTNYCNLHNLASASGLQFKEDVSASQCTQLSSANCDKY